MNISNEFEKKYGKQNILNKCRENKCHLKDINKKDYLILSGDDIKSKYDGEKSVDCIIIDLNKNLEDEYRIILCELTKGTKELKEAEKKFKDSGKLITEDMHSLDLSIYKINCLLLGHYSKNTRNVNKKILRKRFRIEGHNELISIQRENCGYSIKNILN